MELLREYLDLGVFGILGLMSFLMLWFAFERLIYYWRLRLSEFDHPAMLNVALTRNLTWISTIGSNAPYVGLLGTVFGILITFYDIGQSSNIEPAAIMTGLALALTFPVWLTVNYLGNPDNGVIVASYLGSFLMAGAFLSIGACISAVTRNQVIAFIVGFTVSFLFVMSGLQLVLNFFRAWAPDILVSAISSMRSRSRASEAVKEVLSTTASTALSTLRRPKPA